MGYFHSLQRQLCWPIVVCRAYSNANSAATLVGTGFHLCLSTPRPHPSAHGVLDSDRASSSGVYRPHARRCIPLSFAVRMGNDLCKGYVLSDHSNLEIFGIHWQPCHPCSNKCERRGCFQESSFPGLWNRRAAFSGVRSRSLYTARESAPPSALAQCRGQDLPCYPYVPFSGSSSITWQ